MKGQSLIAFFKGHWTRNSFLASVLVHLLFVGFAVGYVAIRVTHKPQSTLVAEEAPRPALELRKLEMQVKVADLQKNSARPRLQPRLLAQSPTDIALPEIKVMRDVQQRVIKREFATVGVSGLGTGIGGGTGDGMGGGASEISFFGLKGMGEKICLIVDVSKSMCEDERGGLKGYQKVKRDVINVIRSFKDGLLFNVIVFEDGVARCWDRLRPSTKVTRLDAESWVNAYNRLEGPYGLPSSNYAPPAYGLEAQGGTSRLDLALTAAFEQGSDAIFVITDGVPQIIRSIETDSNSAAAPVEELSEGEYQSAMKAWENAVAAWDKENAKRTEKGLGPKLTEGGGGRPAQPSRRRGGSRATTITYWTTDDVLAHMQTLQETLYTEKGRGEASVHVVAYSVDGVTRKFLRKLARENQGKYRSIRGD